MQLGPSTYSKVQRSLSTKMVLWGLCTILVFTLSLTALDLWELSFVVAGQGQTTQMILWDKLPLLMLRELSLCGFTGLLLFLYMRRTFVRPLRQVIQHLHQFDPDQNNPDLKITKTSIQGKKDELDVLVDHVNELKNRIMVSHWELKDANIHLERRVEERTETILHQRHTLEANARWSALGEMAGSIAHEINNPLAIIMGKAQLLMRKENSPYARSSLELIVKTTERIASIIQSLRVLSRDASGDPFEYISLSQVLNDALGLSRERLEHLGINLEISPQLHSWEIFCRRVQVSQILVNLINNSIDALEKRSDKWIRMEGFESQGCLVVSLTDSGPGIPAEIREKIMTPFFTTKEVGKGTGMGLSLSKSIMTAHQGTLDIDFEAKHTTLRMSFPTYRHRAHLEKLSG